MVGTPHSLLRTNRSRSALLLLVGDRERRTKNEERSTQHGTPPSTTMVVGRETRATSHRATSQRDLYNPEAAPYPCYNYLMVFPNLLKVTLPLQPEAGLDNGGHVVVPCLRRGERGRSGSE